eukprot:2781877-Amphidinium_carterae.1
MPNSRDFHNLQDSGEGPQIINEHAWLLPEHLCKDSDKFSASNAGRQCMLSEQAQCHQSNHVHHHSA